MSIVLGLFHDACACKVACSPRPHVLKGPEKKMSGAHSSQTAMRDTMSVGDPLPVNVGVTVWVAAEAFPGIRPASASTTPARRIASPSLLHKPRIGTVLSGDVAPRHLSSAPTLRPQDAG